MKGSKTTDRVVILDRDGTIVVDKHYLSSPAGLEFLPGAEDGLRWFYGHGYKLVVITNQSGVGRGLFSLQCLEEIHHKFSQMVSSAGARIEKIYFCPHSPDDGCACRKPRIGLLLQAASELGFNPAEAIVIGDKATDIEFGRRAGATTILIAPKTDAPIGNPAPDFVAGDLSEAARAVESLQAD
jgi:D-glycero-D-manno-heptose 1,7-bisphosphate phosphatase